MVIRDDAWAHVPAAEWDAAKARIADLEAENHDLRLALGAMSDSLPRPVLTQKHVDEAERRIALLSEIQTSTTRRDRYR